MKTIKLVLLLTVMLFINTVSAQVIATSQHGTNCMSANLAQGQLLSWNRNGLTNNFSSSLFVICPVPLEHTAIDAGATEITVDVDWYLPPSYSDQEGPLCVFRIGQTGFGNPELFYYVNQAERAGFNPNGNLGFHGFTRFVVPITFNNMGQVDALISGHLLCRVPPDADLNSYSIVWN